jgi:membrane associated rhomboid family serine protease
MTQPLFRIVFRGEIAFGYTPQEVKANLQRLCRYDAGTVERLFSGRPATLKSNLDASAAGRYKSALDRTGALCTVEPMPTAAPVAPATVGPAASAPSVPSAAPEAPPEPPQVVCPKCNLAQPPGLSCIGCGIVFAKYERAQTRQAAGGPATAPALPPGEEPSGDWSERLSAYFARHQEQAFLVKVLLLIVAIVTLRQFVSGGLLLLAFFLFPVVFLVGIRLHAVTTGENPSEVLAQHITFMPVMYAEGERKQEGTAWVTFSLIFLNILIFYGIEIRLDPQTLLDNFLFLPHQPNLWNVPASAFTAMFLHAGGGHLWGNMIFLWTIGTVVERRIGPWRLLCLYLLTGLLAGAFGVVVHRLFLGSTLHALGASGAIAGVMGIFAVRCYFKSMVFPLPILGIFSLILPVSLKVRLNSLVIIGLFFLADLSGGVAQISGSSESMVGHWIHIGGMAAGALLAMRLKLGNQAIEERHLEIGAQALAGGKVALGAGEESLRLALKQNPDNAEALLMLARIESRYSPTEEGAKLYRRAVPLLLGSRPKEAAAAFREYFLKYMQGMQGIAPEAVFRLSGVFLQEGDLDMASRCLELLAGNAQTPAGLRERAMFQCARVLEEMGLPDAAADWYGRFVETFPGSPNLAKARARLAAV